MKTETVEVQGQLLPFVVASNASEVRVNGITSLKIYGVLPAGGRERYETFEALERSDAVVGWADWDMQWEYRWTDKNEKQYITRGSRPNNLAFANRTEAGHMRFDLHMQIGSCKAVVASRTDWTPLSEDLHILKTPERRETDLWQPFTQQGYYTLRFWLVAPDGSMRKDSAYIPPSELYSKLPAIAQVLQQLNESAGWERLALRTLTNSTKPQPPLPIKFSSPTPAPIQDARMRLQGLIGLQGMKQEVETLVAVAQVRRQKLLRGLPASPHTLHMVFTGNPGTGKTTVARIIGEIYKEIGLIAKGHCIETSRQQLVAPYVGHTAPKVEAVFRQALGGVLFIDEAYTLAQGGENDFGKEAIDALLKLMEDHRDEVIVIVAGYPEEIRAFVERNPGLYSRFPTYVHFEDFEQSELDAIFAQQAQSQGLQMDDAAKEAASAAIARKRAGLNANEFANGRGVRNLFEAVVKAQAVRVAKLEAPSDEDLQTLTATDFASFL